LRTLGVVLKTPPKEITRKLEVVMVVVFCNKYERVNTL